MDHHLNVLLNISKQIKRIRNWHHRSYKLSIYIHRGENVPKFRDLVYFIRHYVVLWNCWNIRVDECINYGTIRKKNIDFHCRLFFIYKFLPETENRTLEDIELYFTDSRRKWTDIKIVKQKSVETNDKENNSVKGCDNKAFVQNLH